LEAPSPHFGPLCAQSALKAPDSVPNDHFGAHGNFCQGCYAFGGISISEEIAPEASRLSERHCWVEVVDLCGTVDVDPNKSGRSDGGVTVEGV
jgi:hypothetical protein